MSTITPELYDTQSNYYYLFISITNFEVKKSLRISFLIEKFSGIFHTFSTQ